LQHLNEDRSEFLAESAAESGQGVVVRMPVAGDEPKRQRVVGGPFDLAARMRAGGVAVDQQRQQQRRVVGVTASTSVDAFQCRQVQPFDNIHHVPRQVRFR